MSNSPNSESNFSEKMEKSDDFTELKRAISDEKYFRYMNDLKEFTEYFVHYNKIMGSVFDRDQINYIVKEVSLNMLKNIECEK